MGALNVTILSFCEISESLDSAINDLSIEITHSTINGHEVSNSSTLFLDKDGVDNQSLCCIFCDSRASPTLWEERVNSFKRTGALVLLFLVSKAVANERAGSLVISHITAECACFEINETEFPIIADGLRALVSIERLRTPTDGAFDWNDVMTMLGRSGCSHMIQVPWKNGSKPATWFIHEMQRLAIPPGTLSSAYLLMSVENFWNRNIRDLGIVVRKYCLPDAVIAVSNVNKEVSGSFISIIFI